MVAVDSSVYLKYNHSREANTCQPKNGGNHEREDAPVDDDQSLRMGLHRAERPLPAGLSGSVRRSEQTGPALTPGRRPQKPAFFSAVQNPLEKTAVLPYNRTITARRPRRHFRRIGP